MTLVNVTSHAANDRSYLPSAHGIKIDTMSCLNYVYMCVACDKNSVIAIIIYIYISKAPYEVIN